ncbi:MAG: type II toxin-antitoxin system prevent-host-death family antitoxin [Nesterenkonia sp.]|uniref:type II toxin-antitoxin system Phd/YefM family antitoxin n=1 Tax=Nesterenkonia marinintestina TaxID=2979865 RepID=UPI0021C063C2|nr:type II toxin-antitoxin system prevent-host-death family antitoxin [Nesterenkonia sp. GX14115]MDO5493067.1 type II toxin-antitoxin system prevent-host-death family antitoxin [Nesterenkonia sp.]
MNAVQVNMHEAKSQLSALVERVLAGEEVTIARAGRPVVDLVVHTEPAVVIGLGRREATTPVEVFDGPDAEIAEMFYGDSEADPGVRPADG